MDNKHTYNWSEMVRYWNSHNAERGRFDSDRDPDGLNNVCHSGAPTAVNRHYDRGQRRVYLSLLSQVPTPSGARALDVGCGAARWSRLLDASGYQVTGIDLQSDLIDANITRHPNIRFFRCELQDFRASRPFHLVSSVTVLQHMPYAEQIVAAERISSLVEQNGHLIILENIADRAPHVFPNSAPGWIQLFEKEGFSARTVLPYDYSPALRAYGRLRLRNRPEPGDLPAPERFGMERTSMPPVVRRAGLVAASMVDSILDPALERLHAPLSTVHVGILFQKAS